MKKILKIIELQIKSLLKTLVFKTKSRTSPVVLTSFFPNLNYIKRILILRQDRLGDVLVSLPFLSLLKNHFKQTDTFIDILLSSKNSGAKFALVNYVDKIYILPKGFSKTYKLIKRLRQEEYDLIIDLLDNPSFTSSLLIRLIKPRYSLGFDKENRNIYTHILPLPNKISTHIIDRILEFLKPFGIEPKFDSKFISLSVKEFNLLPQKHKKRIGIILSGSSQEKFWGINNFNELIKLINNKFDFEIVIFATAKHKKFLQNFNNLKNVYFAPFVSEFEKFASMVQTCDFLVSPDTSSVHLASAFKIPVVALYTFENNRYGMPWFPYGTKSVTLVSKRAFYSDISPKEVFDGLVKLIEH